MESSRGPGGRFPGARPLNLGRGRANAQDNGPSNANGSSSRSDPATTNAPGSAQSSVPRGLPPHSSGHDQQPKLPELHDKRHSGSDDDPSSWGLQTLMGANPFAEDSSSNGDFGDATFMTLGLRDSDEEAIPATRPMRLVPQQPTLPETRTRQLPEVASGPVPSTGKPEKAQGEEPGPSGPAKAKMGRVGVLMGALSSTKKKLGKSAAELKKPKSADPAAEASGRTSKPTLSFGRSDKKAAKVADAAPGTSGGPDSSDTVIDNNRMLSNTRLVSYHKTLEPQFHGLLSPEDIAHCVKVAQAQADTMLANAVGRFNKTGERVESKAMITMSNVRDIYLGRAIQRGFDARLQAMGLQGSLKSLLTPKDINAVFQSALQAVEVSKRTPQQAVASAVADAFVRLDAGKLAQVLALGEGSPDRDVEKVAVLAAEATAMQVDRIDWTDADAVNRAVQNFGRDAKTLYASCMGTPPVAARFKGVVEAMLAAVIGAVQAQPGPNGNGDPVEVGFVALMKAFEDQAGELQQCLQAVAAPALAAVRDAVSRNLKAPQAAQFADPEALVRTLQKRVIMDTLLRVLNPPITIGLNSLRNAPGAPGMGSMGGKITQPMQTAINQATDKLGNYTPSLREKTEAAMKAMAQRVDSWLAALTKG